VAPTDGAAFAFPKGAELVARITYRKTWKYENTAMTDRSAIGVYLTDLSHVREIAAVHARLCLALRSFFHPAAGRELLWNLRATPRLRPLLDAIADPAVGFQDVVLQSGLENLWVAPARIALAKMEAKLVGEMDAHFRLKDKLEPVRKQYPQVVIDCPPTLGLLTVNALVAATHLLIPIQSSYFALEGTDDLLETIEKVRARPNPALRILGVVITMHDKRTALARDIRTQIQKVFGGKVFKTVITKSVRLEESPAYKESIFTFAPESSGATEYYSLCEEVIDRA